MPHAVQHDLGHVNAEALLHTQRQRVEVRHGGRIAFPVCLEVTKEFPPTIPPSLSSWTGEYFNLEKKREAREMWISMRTPYSSSSSSSNGGRVRRMNRTVLLMAVILLMAGFHSNVAMAAGNPP